MACPFWVGVLAVLKPTEYGATCGFFPIDDDTLTYLNATGRDEARIELVEVYAKAQGLWRDGSSAEYTDTLSLDVLKGSAKTFAKILRDEFDKTPVGDSAVPVKGEEYSVDHGDVFIAAITSCTNTSNPSVMMAAGLVAQKANEKGLTVKPWVKTSLAPGSQVVGEYLEKSKLQTELNQLGFDVVGYSRVTSSGKKSKSQAAKLMIGSQSQLTCATPLILKA